MNRYLFQEKDKKYIWKLKKTSLFLLYIMNNVYFFRNNLYWNMKTL